MSNQLIAETEGNSALPLDEQVSVAPFLRWAGSKRKILTDLAEYWQPTYDRYVEPFVGCAALFFRIQPRVAVLGDINTELMATYEIVRQFPEAVYQAVKAMPAGPRHYYPMRSRNPNRLKPFNRAVRFLYLNRYCFNGIYRTNLKGVFNVPFGGVKAGAIPPIESFRKCAQALKQATLRQCDFGHILRDTRKGDFVYLDPPYAVRSRKVFREYGPRHFAEIDLRRLTAHLTRMDKRGVHFVVSYADCAEARAHLKKWNPRRIRVRRNIAGFTASRRTAYEIIATNIDR